MRNINVDLMRTKGKHDKFFKECASTGRACLILRSDHQQHLSMASRECGFRHLRFHGLLHDDMAVYREDKDGNPIYSWQYVDAVYDYILSISMRPFVGFTFMPERLASGDSTVYWWKANITPPKDYGRWEELVYEVVRHFTERYGYEEVKQWYFEVWNEPDQYRWFFTGDIDEYFKLYESTARAVKSVCQDYRVGGPATAGGDLDKWIGGLIGYCHRNRVPIDFITTHTYSAKGITHEGKEGELDCSPGGAVGVPVWLPGTPWPQGNVYHDPEGAVGAVRRAYDLVKASAMPDLDIYFTEWGLTCDYWDPLRDSYHAASYILSRLKAVQGYVKAMSYCEVSDVFEEDGPPTDHFHGGFGLVNLQGLRKPSFFAYSFLNHLGDTELECDDPNTFACCDANGVQLLFWDCAVRQDRTNKEYYNRDTPSLSAEKVQLSIAGLRPGTYELSVYCTGYRRNDVYTAYLDMKHPGTLTQEQIRLLDEQNNGSPAITGKIVIADNSCGVFQYDVDVRENDVYLITLEA